MMKKKNRKAVIRLKLFGVFLIVCGCISIIPGIISLWDPNSVAWSVFTICLAHSYKLVAVVAGVLLYIVGVNISNRLT